MIAKHSKKGFISIFWIAIMMVVTTALMVTATYMFSIFAATPIDLMSRPLQEYYNAEFGISYGNFLLVNSTPALIGLVVGASQPPYNVPINGTNVTVTITHRSLGLHYTITSLLNNRTITANWDEGILTQIN